MNKAELVAAVANKAAVTKTDAERVVTAVFDAVTEAVARGESVTLVGFGSFEARSRAARTGKNPKTGEALQIKATTVPAFRAGKVFKDAVANK